MIVNNLYFFYNTEIWWLHRCIKKWVRCNENQFEDCKNIQFSNANMLSNQKRVI